ncbi:hypothetical protein VMCG_09023 [Cytospora schulzeri]|uniref:Clr5 domain-containing protein n=1 Tax=Cytospora schulzeri TaxID=448051 RepID=A0A423VPQ5_9PEZI|nr:hypothetical protein VMCG_09023 [Valsa malicola]
MAYSTPSPSETCSDWSGSGRGSGSFSDCGTSIASAGTVYTTMGHGHLDSSCMPPSTFMEKLFPEPYDPRFSTPVSNPYPTDATMATGPTHQASHKSVKRRYASEDDWRRHRDKITSLYKIKRLRDVMTIMENEHNLYATERMYKARFKDWGLHKNVTAAKVHKLMQKVEQEQKRRQYRRSPSDDKGRVVLDIGDDLDVPRIQKYMKRRPKGLDNLRKDPHRPLEVIKALSVDGGNGRGKVSIATVKLEEQGQDHDGFLQSPLLGLDLPWSPGSEVPGEITRLLQTFIDDGFDAAGAYKGCPRPFFTPSLSPQWQQNGHGHSNSLDSITSSLEAVAPRDEMMLDFVLKLRVVNILFEEGYDKQGYQGFRKCLDSLALCIQQSQNTPGLGMRPTTVVVLWALSAALEILVDLKEVKEWALQSLYRQLMSSCAEYQPTMAEIVGRLSQLGSREQVATIKVARQTISSALFVDPSYYEPSFETYSRTVDVAVSSQSASEKAQEIHKLSSKPILPGSSALDAWAEMRTALAMRRASPSLQQDFYKSTASPWMPVPVTTPSWNGQGSKIASVLEYISGRIEFHRTAGSWQTAQELMSHAASVTEMTWGSDTWDKRIFNLLLWATATI